MMKKSFLAFFTGSMLEASSSISHASFAIVLPGTGAQAAARRPVARAGVFCNGLMPLRFLGAVGVFRLAAGTPAFPAAPAEGGTFCRGSPCRSATKCLGFIDFFCSLRLVACWNGS
jgi:hypothetical protein